MLQEQNATLEGLQTALQMEIDGKEFYIKSAKASRNKQGKHLLEKLAEEEDVHRKVFKNIYENIKKKNRWPDSAIHTEPKNDIKTVFKEAIEKMDKNYTAIPEELDAVTTGIGMENKTLDYYRERGSKASSQPEKQLYESLAMQESEHSRVLQDYYDFLKDPAAYFVKTEHTSMDGG